MFSLLKRQTVEERFGEPWDIRFGKYTNAEELIRAFETRCDIVAVTSNITVRNDGCHFVAPHAKDRIRSPDFPISPRSSRKLVWTTPRILDPFGRVGSTPAHLIAWAHEKFGLEPCPADTAVYAMVQFGLATNRPNLFLSGTGLTDTLVVTSVDLVSSALGVWHFQREIPRDYYVWFALPE